MAAAPGVGGRRSKLGSAAAVGVAACLLAACGSSSSGGDTASTGNTSLKVGITPAPGNLDPGGEGLAVDAWVTGNVNEPLIHDYEGEFYPGLATSWEMSPDAKKYTFKLREGVTFQDGTPFDAAAVKATFDHVVDPATKSRAPLAMLGAYSATRVIDDHTVAVEFKQPNVGFKFAASYSVGGQSSPTALKEGAVAYGRAPVGAGPFALDEFVPNQRIELSAFPKYNWAPEFWGTQGASPLKKLTLRILPDAKARSNALKTGELDVAAAIEPQDSASLTASGNFKEIKVDSAGQPYGIPINVTKAPTDDVNVRRALIYAADPAEMISTLFEDKYEPATQLLTPTTEGYDPSLEGKYATNVDKAKQLLDQAGWTPGADGIREKDGKKLELQMINIAGFGFDGIAQLLQAQLKRVGVSVKITAQAFPTVAATLNKGEHNLGNFFYYDLDGRDALNATLNSAQIKAGYNWSHYSNKKVDALLAQANSDAKNREDLLHQVQEIALDDAIFIPIYNLRQLWVTKSDVSGLRFNPAGYPLFYGAKVGSGQE
jgi:peptide/nickel transport system substrate-binding protein